MTNLWTNWKGNSTFSSPQAPLDRTRCWKCAAAGENGPSWNHWQKASREGSKLTLRVLASGTLKIQGWLYSNWKILASYEGVCAVSDMISIEAQLFLAPWLPVLGRIFKGRVCSIHHATDAMWNKWGTPMIQCTWIGNPSGPGILEVIIDWPEGKDFGILPKRRWCRLKKLHCKWNTRKWKPICPGECCHILGKYHRWKAAVWSSIHIAETAEWQGESSQFSEVKAGWKLSRHRL